MYKVRTNQINIPFARLRVDRPEGGRGRARNQDLDPAIVRTPSPASPELPTASRQLHRAARLPSPPTTAAQSMEAVGRSVAYGGGEAGRRFSEETISAGNRSSSVGLRSE